MMLAALVTLAAVQEPTTLRLIEVAPAETVAVHELGYGDAIVIVPGLLGSAYGFRHIMPQLADAGFRVIVVDMLGTGSSNAPEKADYSLTAQAERVLIATRILGIERAVHVCHAIGGSVCYRMALREPDRIASILSINGGPAEQLATPGMKSALKFAPLIKLFGGTGRVRSKVREGMIKSSYDPSWVTDSVVAGYTAHYSQGVGHVLGTLKRMVNAKEPAALAPGIPQISLPVRVMIGSGSTTGAMTPDDITSLQALPALALDSVASAGQYIHEERPALVVAAVLESARTAQTAAAGASPASGWPKPVRTAADTVRQVARAPREPQDSRAPWFARTLRSAPPR